VEYTQKTGNIPLSSQFHDAAIGNFTTDVTSAAFGLFQWSPNMMGCTDYDDTSQLGTAFKTARVGGVLASSAGILALFIATVEFICCRFVCARVLMCILLVIALIGQGLTFVLYASDICLHKGNVVYACDFGAACGWSVLATFCFLAASVFVCPTPKPQPLCKKMCGEREQRPVADPCCYCIRREKHVDEDHHETPVIANNDHEADQQSVALESQVDAAETYPKEVYTSAHDGASSVRFADDHGGTTLPPSSDVASVRSVPQQYHYFAPPTSFSNAEVLEGDLFFDSKTV